MKGCHVFCVLLMLIARSIPAQTALHVMSSEDMAPVPYAGIWLPGTHRSFTCDSLGNTQLPPLKTTDSLWVIMGGFTTWKGTLHSLDHGKILLRPVATDTVEIWSQRPYMLLNNLPFKEERYLPETFRAVPDADISTGLDHIGGLRKQVNCGICGTADIHMNGMEGAYTTFLFNGVPLSGALANIYGIYSVPVPLLREVRITRGPGSVWNGPEGAGGTIGFDFLKPGTAAGSGYAGFQGSSFGEMLGDAGWVGKGQVLAWSGYRMKSVLDKNGDGFTDVPMSDRHTLFWSFGQDSAAITGMVKGYLENRTGGQLAYLPLIHRGGDQVYGEHVRTRRIDLTLRSAWLGRSCKTQLLSGYAFHHQNSWYGTTYIWAEQHSGMLTLRGMDPSGKFTTGTQVRMQQLTDNTPVADGSLARWWIPTLLAEYQSDSARIQLSAGARADLTPFGLIPVLRSGILWRWHEFQSVRVLLGNGYRMVNIFTEDHASLTGSRKVVLPPELKPERVTSFLSTYHALVPVGNSILTQDIDLFHTRFRNQVFADYSRDGLIAYQNLAGSSWLWGMNINFRMSAGQHWQLSAGTSLIYGRYLSETGVRAAPYLTPPWMMNGELRYTSEGGSWAWILTVKATGPMRLPEHASAPGTSRPYAGINAAAYYTINKGWELMLSLQNITGYRIPSPILGADDPWGSNFDTTRIYGPVTGIRMMAGISRKW